MSEAYAETDSQSWTMFDTVTDIAEPQKPSFQLWDMDVVIQEPHPERLKPWHGRLLRNSDGRVIGSGHLMSSGAVLTASHVALTEDSPARANSPRKRKLPEFSFGLRAAFLASVAVEGMALLIVLAIPVFDQRALLMPGCALSALGFAALSAVAARAGEIVKETE